jgi:DNA-directed RNA polymerase sigma subunit (sigma70/sigma32)
MNCLHCHRPGAGVPRHRGLCYPCYADLDVRPQYPTQYTDERTDDEFLAEVRERYGERLTVGQVQEVLGLRQGSYRKWLTQEEVADLMGITRQAVQQMESRALRKLKLDADVVALAQEMWEGK